jgi:hypothetical protein
MPVPLADASGGDFARHESPATLGFGLILCRASGSASGRSRGATGKCAAVPCGVAQGDHRAARGLHLFGPGRGDSVWTAARPRVGHRACRRDWAGALHRGAWDRLPDGRMPSRRRLDGCPAISRMTACSPGPRARGHLALTAPRTSFAALLPQCFPQNNVFPPRHGWRHYLTDIVGFFGAGEGIRTLDPNLGKVVLYH